MSAQDNTEKVLKSLHVMIAKGQSYELDPSKVVVDRDKMLSLLKELNQCMYAMMEEYELTRQSKDKAEREFRKRGDEIVMDASRKAEDIYAASVIYTDEALSSIQEIMQKANDSVKAIYNEMDHKMEEQKHIVRTNQLELKSQIRRYTTLSSSGEVSDTVYEAGGLVINDDLKKVTVDGEEVKLTPIEYNILLLLVKNQGKVFSISQIYENIWNEEAVGVDNTVAVHIRHIREKIEINPKEPRYLKVVWGVGYKIEKSN